MEKNNITMELRIRIKEYLRYIWKEEKTQFDEDEKNVLSSLPTHLRNEFLSAAYGAILCETPIFFENFSKKALNETIYRGYLKQIRYTPGDIIFDVRFFIKKNFKT